VPALNEYAGRYISSITCRTCTLDDDQVFVVKTQPNGTLSLWGQTWWRCGVICSFEMTGKRLLGFARDEKSRIVSVTAGSWRVADRLP
jgi:hypothetical protein